MGNGGTKQDIKITSPIAIAKHINDDGATQRFLAAPTAQRAMEQFRKTIEDNDISAAKALLQESGANAPLLVQHTTWKVPERPTPLHYVCIKGRLDMLALLLQVPGVNVNVTTKVSNEGGVSLSLLFRL